MKLTTKAQRNIFGKLSGNLIAEIEHNGQVILSDTGASKDEALENLARKIEQQERNGHVRTYRWATDGTLFALYFAGSWAYDIVKRDGSPASSCFMATPHQGEALRAMENHVAQYGN